MWQKPTEKSYRNAKWLPIQGSHQAVEKPLTGFSDKFLQSAARTPCSPTANNSHTCSLRSIFCQVHAPTENDLILFGGLRRQTLRGFFDKLKGRGIHRGLCYLLEEKMKKKQVIKLINFVPLVYPKIIKRKSG